MRQWQHGKHPQIGVQSSECVHLTFSDPFLLNILIRHGPCTLDRDRDSWHPFSDLSTGGIGHQETKYSTASRRTGGEIAVLCAGIIVHKAAAGPWQPWALTIPAGWGFKKPILQVETGVPPVTPDPR